MLLDNLVLYEKNYITIINLPNDSLYYFFDYDERSAKINMEFQHFHSFYEFCILLDQSAEHLIEGDIYNLQFLDIVALRPSLLHKTQYPQGTPKKRLIINFMYPKELEGLSPDLQRILTIFDHPIPIYRFESPQKEQLFDLINQIYLITKSKTSINTLLLHTKFIEFLSKLYLLKDYNKYISSPCDDGMKSKIYSITSFIHEHYKESLSLEFLADHFYISNYYLSHQFKRFTGFTLINYIQLTRIRNAQLLLQTTNQRITEIADSCGFNSFSQFNRTFRKYSGLSPSQFRTSQSVNHTTDLSIKPE